MKKIALYGRIGSGKTFVAHQIKDKYPNVRVFSFANSLKSLAEDLLSRPINKATDRMFLVYLGQAFKSEILKLMGYDYLEDFIVMAAKDIPFSAQEKGKFLYRIFGLLDNFVNLNPDWGVNDFWAKLLIKEINESDCDIAVVDDLRFNVEYEALAQDGFEFIHILVDDESRYVRLINRDGNFDHTIDNHSSELEWIKFPVNNCITTCPENDSSPLDILDIKPQMDYLFLKYTNRN